MTNAGIDEAVIERLRAVGGDALVRRLLRLFLVNSDDALLRIRPGVEASEWEIVRAAAHYIYASSAQLELERVARHAAALETAARAANAGEVQHAAAALDAALAETRPLLERVLADLPRPPCVAVIDDSEDVRVLLRLVLEPHFELAEYADATTALRGMRRFPPDVAIIDMTLPDVSGLDLLHFMRADERLLHVPAIALTAMDSLDGDSFVDAGFALHVRKPVIDTDQFARSVASLVPSQHQVND